MRLDKHMHIVKYQKYSNRAVYISLTRAVMHGQQLEMQHTNISIIRNIATV